MTNAELLLWLIVCVPLVGSCLLPLIGRVSEPARNLVALLFVAAPLCGIVGLIPRVFHGRTLSVAAAGFTWFSADVLAVFMALVSSLVGAVIVIYSFDYVRRYAFGNEYYCMVVLFLGAMLGLVFSRNLLLLFVFWEITAVASWRLIGFFRKQPCVLRADKAFLVTVFGALAMLLGFIMLWGETGSLDLAVIRDGGRAVSDLTVLLILVGILAKSATFPLHTWLPDAGVAPSPVTALLHAAVLVKIGVYMYARLFVATIAPPEIWQTVVPLIAGVSAIVSAGAALVETDLKRIIAYSTISQIGFIFLGFAVGGRIAVGGALLFILMHGIAKGGLFLCAGIVEQRTHEKDITKLGGLAAVMPVTALSFLACAFSVMGIPPFGGFFSKYMVMTGAFNTGHPWIGMVFLAGACLTLIYLLRVFTLVFLGSSRAAAGAALPEEGTPLMVGSVAFLAMLAAASGVLVAYPQELAYAAVRQMLGVP